MAGQTGSIFFWLVYPKPILKIEEEARGLLDNPR
jgi:hypothetical protein